MVVRFADTDKQRQQRRLQQQQQQQQHGHQGQHGHQPQHAFSNLLNSQLQAMYTTQVRPPPRARTTRQRRDS